MELTVRVGRWRCRNRGCPRRIFCQRLPDIAPTHARQTKRFGEVGHAVAHALGGRAGERLSRRLGIPVGRNALLRGLKRWARSRLPAGPIPVIGVDEWAWRKRQNYGTILVDLQKGVVADLLPDRSAASFETVAEEASGRYSREPGSRWGVCGGCIQRCCREHSKSRIASIWCRV